MENIMDVPQKIKNCIIIWLINSSPVYIFLKKGHIISEKKNPMHANILSNPIYYNQDMEAPLVSINRGKDKKYVVYLCNWILLSHKKNKIMQFVAPWIDFEGIC